MRSSEHPNILWYCTDSQRYDTIGALGNMHIATPTLDGLIKGGAAFTRAYAQSTMCTPSRVSFMTGRYCASHHVYRNGNAGLPPTETMVTKLLAEAGYDCALIGKLHMSSSKFGEQRPDDGYRAFYWSNLPNPDGADHLNAYHHWLRDELGVDPRELYKGPRPFVGAGMPAEYTQTRWATEMAKRFICEERNGPWLVSVNPFSPHPPYDPPKEYLDRHDPAQMPPPLFRESDLERQSAFAGIRHQNIHARNPLHEEGAPEPNESMSAEYFAAQTYRPPTRFNGRLMKCGYYAQIEVIDHFLGELIDCLRDSGQLDNTILVYHSDHGELLGDHGLAFKGARFFEGAVHVPMLWHWPEAIVAGFKSDALVELVDIAPTLLEAAGLAKPHYVQGKSLLPMMTGSAAADFHKAHAVCDFYDSVGYSQVDDPTQATMSFDGRYKMIIYHRHGLGELFDLREDPGEFDNLWSRPECRDLKLEILLRHIDAVMATVSPGPPRITQY